jgi:DNA-binding FadR family transcriptional regulator
LYLHVNWVFRLGASNGAAHSWAEHIRLVDAIEAADPSAAEAATSVHVAAAAVAALDNLKNR